MCHCFGAVEDLTEEERAELVAEHTVAELRAEHTEEELETLDVA